MKLAVLILLMVILFIIHEFGHYLAYQLLGIDTYFKMSVIAPQVLPKQNITITKVAGLFVALSGFIISILLFVYPLSYFYNLWKALLVGSLAGSIADFLWAISMIFVKEVTIYSTYSQ